MRKKHGDGFSELAALFFSTRQIIRANVGGDKPDQNAWLRFETLRFIADNDAPTMRGIAGHLRITAPSATSIVARLKRMGWVVQEKKGEDKRVVRIVPTKKGQELLKTYRINSAAIMRRVFSKLPEKDIATLIDIFQRVGAAHRE